MGYLLKRLANLPIQENVDIYIFVIGESWSGGLIDVINNNYKRIADAIGEDAIIISGFDDQYFGEEVSQRYLGVSTRDDKIWSLIPAILVTDSHPEQLRSDSLRILFPLHKIEAHFGSVDQFLAQLVEFAKTGNSAFLENIKETNSFLEAANEIVDLKPNFFGIGLNLNKVLERIVRR